MYSFSCHLPISLHLWFPSWHNPHFQLIPSMQCNCCQCWRNILIHLLMMWLQEMRGTKRRERNKGSNITIRRPTLLGGELHWGACHLYFASSRSSHAESKDNFISKYYYILLRGRDAANELHTPTHLLDEVGDTSWLAFISSPISVIFAKLQWKSVI